MFPSGEVTKIGGVKHSAPPPSKIMPETPFRRDVETLRHLPIVHAGDQRAADAARVEDAALSLIRRFNADGRLVRKHGEKNGIFEARAVELTGISKRDTWKGVARLLDLGAIIDDPERGLMAVVSTST
jgi:hypothetical protein